MHVQSGLWIELLLLVGLSASVVTVTVTKIYRTLAQCALKIRMTANSAVTPQEQSQSADIQSPNSVSYTHLTLPTIYSV